MPGLRRSLRRCLGIALMAATLGLAAQAGPGLVWKLALLRWAGTGYESLPFSRPLELRDGDSLQLFIEAEVPCYCYVIDEDSAGAVTVLYASTLKGGTPLYLPSENENFKVASPPRGSERIHVVVSLERQKNLERLVAKLASARGDRSAESRSLVDEVLTMRQALSALAEAPERPVPMGGVSRWIGDSRATEFSGRTTNVKTIRFDY